MAPTVTADLTPAGSSDTGSDNHQATLPLGWTRIKRKRRSNEDDECCEDPTQCRVTHRRRQVRSSESSNDKIVTSVSSSNPKLTSFSGHVLFCLHDTDPSWIQGYFWPRGGAGTKPWRLLAIQQEIDDCLACCDGGYRKLQVKVWRKGTTTSLPQPTVLSNIEWKGGDMMQLATELDFASEAPPGPSLSMETQRLWTGSSALPRVEQYFSSLLMALREQCQVDSDLPVLEWLPDVAVVLGTMELRLPREEQGDDGDDGFLNGRAQSLVIREIAKP